MIDERRVYRGRDGQVLALVGLWVLLVPFVVWGSWPDGWRALAFIGPLGPGLYLFGLANSVVVTRETVTVRNTFHSWRVGRSLILPQESSRDTFLNIEGHGPISISAFDSAFNNTPSRRAVAWLRQALTEIPPLPDDGRRVLRVRWINVVVLVAAVGVFFGYT